MKTFLLSIILLSNSWLVLSQFGTQQIITENDTFTNTAITHDIDNDGFIDIVSINSGNLVWYKNQDGLGDFSNEIIIVENITNIRSVKFHDFDGDGYKDIIYIAFQTKIAWIKNIDGQGNFGNEEIIAEGNYPEGYPYRIEVSDIDGDGDNDVFANLYHNSIFNRLVWYKNIDGTGNFSDEIIIEINDFYDSDLTLFDLDNDGDNDLITSYESYNPSTLIWYENIDSQGNFSESQEIFQFDYLSDWVSIFTITHTDFNNDGKIDILIDSHHEDFLDIIYWLENIDSDGTFSEPKNIISYEANIGSLKTYDIDNDNDNDILISFCAGASSRIIWIKNLDGLGDFGEELVISTEVDCGSDTSAADFDGDGLLDVVSASSGDNKIAWYKNEILGIDDTNNETATIYPNPTKNTVTISSNIAIKSIEVYNILGERLITNTQNTTIDLSSFSSALYFVKIMNTNGSTETYKIIKE